jgi:hypothetical protein
MFQRLRRRQPRSSSARIFTPWSADGEQLWPWQQEPAAEPRYLKERRAFALRPRRRLRRRMPRT